MGRILEAFAEGELQKPDRVYIGKIRRRCVPFIPALLQLRISM